MVARGQPGQTTAWAWEKTGEASGNRSKGLLTEKGLEGQLPQSGGEEQENLGGVSEEDTQGLGWALRSGQWAPGSPALDSLWAAFASWSGALARGWPGQSPASGMGPGPEERDAHLPRPAFHSCAAINCLEQPPLPPPGCCFAVGVYQS